MKAYPWHGTYPMGIPPSITIEHTTLPEIFTSTTVKYPERPAVIFMEREYTYGEMEIMINRLANALKSLGIRRGDRIAILMPNLPQLVVSYIAIWKIGAVAVPNNPVYTKYELEYHLNDSGAKMIIVQDVFAPRIEEVRPRTGITRIIVSHLNDCADFLSRRGTPAAVKTAAKKTADQSETLDLLGLLLDSSSDFTDPPPEINDLALIPYSGGQTGKPTGVMITHMNLTGITQIMRAWFYELSETRERVLGILPLYHMAAFNAVMSMSIINGWSMVLVLSPDPREALAAINKYRPTLIPVVPAILAGMLKLPGFRKADLSFVKAFFSRSVSLDRERIEELKKISGAEIIEAYGMTESTALLTLTPWKGGLRPGSVGVPVPNTEVRIVDVEHGTSDVRTGEAGEIIFRGPQMTPGYYNDDEESEESIRNGWFFTGDIGRMDEDGYIYILDRKKELIVAGGYNIYPREVEEILIEHPRVMEVCVIGIPEKHAWEKVKAFVVPRKGESVTREELESFCRERLSAYKVPRVFEIMDGLPKTQMKRTLRRKLREMELKKAGR